MICVNSPHTYPLPLRVSIPELMQHLKIPITNYALKTNRFRQTAKEENLQENKRCQSRLSAALEQKRVKVPGYRAGCEDQSEVASTALSTSISSISVPSNMRTTRVTSTFAEADIEAAEKAYMNRRNSWESSRKCKMLILISTLKDIMSFFNL